MFFSCICSFIFGPGPFFFGSASNFQRVDFVSLFMSSRPARMDTALTRRGRSHFEVLLTGSPKYYVGQVLDGNQSAYPKHCVSEVEQWETVGSLPGYSFSHTLDTEGVIGMVAPQTERVSLSPKFLSSTQTASVSLTQHHKLQPVIMMMLSLSEVSQAQVDR